MSFSNILYFWGSLVLWYEVEKIPVELDIKSPKSTKMRLLRHIPVRVCIHVVLNDAIKSTNYPL